ncbi:MAG: hypothetical protein IJS76_07240 [Pseudobutyrivibrio sp.]|nr:hypothetical protein [Pseudobutyrivibrio sp.]
MKKIIKPLIVLVVIVGLVVGGLYGYFRYNRGKKIAQVVSLSSYGMDGYWGDSIESYGTVTSEKSQTTYLASGTEVLSVNFAEGDHVEAGDVLLTVKKESQNIRGKELEVEKAQQVYNANVTRLERLENTTPIPEHIASQADTRDKTYVAEATYYLKEGCSFMEYEPGQKVVEISYMYTGEEVARLYYSVDSQKYPLDEEKDAETIESIKSALDAEGDLEAKFDIDEYEVTEEITVGNWYYDTSNGHIIGHEGIGPHGEIREEYIEPKGYTPTQLEEAIDQTKKELARADLDLRIKTNQLEEMRNTNENGEMIAKVSGTVSKVQSADNYNSTQPFMIVSATDEYFISGTIGEFYLDNVHVGDTVAVMSWDNGMSAEAVITDISDNPDTSEESNYYMGGGNTNVSNYSFKASFDRSSGIDIGAAVVVTITPDNVEAGGMYIPNFFIRKDSGGNYVMRMNDKNRLEKVYVKIGKSLWGEMLEVKSGLTMDDCLAFPYGNGAMEGIKCKKVDSLDY